MERRAMTRSGRMRARQKFASRLNRSRTAQSTEKAMALLKQFAPPANVADLTDNDQTNLAQQWSDRVNGWTKEAISTGGDGGTQLDFYYNPLTTEAQNNPISKPVAWTAFPNRILLSFPNA